jgi:hypothetical protein
MATPQAPAALLRRQDHAILSDLRTPGLPVAPRVSCVRTRVEPFPLGDGPGRRIEPFDRSA